MGEDKFGVEYPERAKELAEFRYRLRQFLRFSEAQAERFGVATQQYQLMQVIATLPKGTSASISYLAERMVLRHNSTVELVDRAERAGLVQRANDRRDLRRTIVVLTPPGAEVLAQMLEGHLRELEGETGTHLLQALHEVRSAGEPTGLYASAERTA